MSNIEKHAFIPLSAYEIIKDLYPFSLKFGSSQLITYAVPFDVERLQDLIDSNNYELIKTSDHLLILDAIKSDLTVIYSCDRDCALSVIDALQQNPED